MNWQTATIDEINAYCAKCDQAWDGANGKWLVAGDIEVLFPDDDDNLNPPPYLTLLDGHEELTEYGSRLIRLAETKDSHQFDLCRLKHHPAIQELRSRRWRLWLHAACEVLGEQRKEE